jgi:hypothetical protein
MGLQPQVTKAGQRQSPADGRPCLVWAAFKVGCADLHFAGHPPFGMNCLWTSAAWDAYPHVGEVVRDLCVAPGQLVVEADCEFWPIFGLLDVFHIFGLLAMSASGPWFG